MLKLSTPVDAEKKARFDSVAAAVGVAFHRFRHSQQLARKVRRLEAILEIAGQWNQTLELLPKLYAGHGKQWPVALPRENLLIAIGRG